MKQMTWDDEVTLLGAEEFKEDDLGQQIPVQTETTVCCIRRPVSRQEFYLAGQNDIQVSEVLIIHPYEYNGESAVLFRGKKLRIVKTYEISMEEMELTCTERLGDKDGGALKAGNKGG
ncbi:phage head closure protein [Lachnospiraceae bacterium 62-26]